MEALLIVPVGGGSTVCAGVGILCCSWLCFDFVVMDLFAGDVLIVFSYVGTFPYLGV